MVLQGKMPWRKANGDGRLPLLPAMTENTILFTKIGKFSLITHQSWLRKVQYFFKSHATQQPNVSFANWGNVAATALMAQFFWPCHLFP
jgi:hypothetical protein